MIRPVGAAALAAAFSVLALTASAGSKSTYDPGAPIMTPAPAPVHSVAPVRDWSGAYLAFGVSRTTTSYSSDTAYAPPAGSGTGASLMLGYNLQQDNLVYGAEVLGNFDRISGTGTGCGLGADFTCRSSVRNYLAARVRVGFAFDNTLVFATLGYASDEQDQTIRDDGVRVGQDNARHNGPVIGLGVEHAFDNQWGVRGDLEHYRLGTRSYDLDVPGPTTIRTRHNAARLSVVRRF